MLAHCDDFEMADAWSTSDEEQTFSNLHSTCPIYACAP